MARSTIADRIARQIDRDSDELAGIPAGANLTPVHVATIDCLEDFLELGERLSAGGGTPAPVRTLMRFLKQCRPMLLEQLSDVDPKILQGFVAEIRDKLSVIVDTPTGEDGGGTDDDSGRAPVRSA